MGMRDAIRVPWLRKTGEEDVDDEEHPSAVTQRQNIESTNGNLISLSFSSSIDSRPPL
ncbi:hypothetical protein CASFOL_031616 [Castilleja foliolosa]|uniref:Uncharacterized protein n=1 Tax=Castilleja foliolosa TaxID=1961234 RepID=A0ABD3C627_9LAMI